MADEAFWRNETKPMDFDVTEFKKFVGDLETKSRLSNVNVIDYTPKEPKFHHLNTAGEKLSNYYYNLFVQKQRPEMLKEKPVEFDYDFDFDIDENNYNPWAEYRKIYRDALIKGRAYWIIRAIPEWIFLQVGKPDLILEDGNSRYNPKRPNMEDSVFNNLTQDRYFAERERKMNIYQGYSQAIRI
jgi:hypothetical protein